MKKWLAVLIVSTSCTLYPPYHRPDFETPDAWRTALNQENGIDIGWWEQFNDEALNQLIDDALINNQDLKIAIARVDQFQAELGIARSKFFPQIQLDTFIDRHKNSGADTSPTYSGKQIYNAFDFLLNASYLVDLWGEVRSAVEASYHEWLASIEARRIVVLQLISSTANTYIQLRQFDQQLIISQQTVEDRNRYYYLAKIRFELGLTSEMPVEQALTEVKIAEADVENYRIAIAQAENLLSVLIGQPSMAIKRGTILDQLIMPPSIPHFIPADIVCQRPDLRAAEEKLMAAGARIGVAKAQFFPRISLTGSFGSESNQLHAFLNHPFKVWEYGTDILQEIFTGGRLTSNLRLTQAQQREALHSYLSIVLNAFKEVNDAMTTHQINLALVETQKQRLQATKNYLHFSDLLYLEGETDYLTFLDAQRQFYQSEIDYQSAIGNSFQSLIRIYQALGGGWVIQADADAMSD